jgi:hypothetical protein
MKCMYVWYKLTIGKFVLPYCRLFICSENGTFHSGSIHNSRKVQDHLYFMYFYLETSNNNSVINISVD